MDEPGRVLDAVRRVIDVTFATMLLVLSLPVLILAAAAVAIVDRTPVFFSQQRDGLSGKPFRVFKLRTMRVDADAVLREILSSDPRASEEWDKHLRLENDPRLIPVIGGFLRRWSIDEIPQFLNVLRGEMTLVGPRPLALDVIERFPADFLASRRNARPGVTGLWQVSGRNDGDLSDWRRLDEEYLRRRSIGLDARILARTPRAVLTRRGAF